MCLHSCTLRAVVSPGWDTSYPAWRKHCLQGSIPELCKIMAFLLSSRNNAILCFVCLFLCCGLCSTAVISTLVVFLWNKIVLLPDLCSSCVSYPAREYSRVKRKSSHSWILLQWNFDIKKGGAVTRFCHIKVLFHIFYYHARYIDACYIKVPL